MTTKSKSSLFAIIVIAVILFISAIIWKNTRVDNSEEIFIEPVIKNKTIATKKSIPVIDAPIKQEPTIQTEDDRKIAVASAEKKMGMYIQYRTPEQIVEAVKTLEQLGKHDEADELIQMLIDRFPDFKF